MNKELEYLFTDTDTFLSEEEENVLKTLEEIGGNAVVRRSGTKGAFVLTKPFNLMFGMVNKGLLRIFSLGECVYIFSKTHPKCRSITVEFNAYFAKVGRTASGEVKVFSEDERDKIAFGRGFIANWIFNKTVITEEEHIRFLTIFTSRASYTMGIPEFLIDQFQKDIDKTGMEYRVLTPEYKMAHCSFCRHNFQVRDEVDTMECPKCNEAVLIR